MVKHPVPPLTQTPSVVSEFKVGERIVAFLMVREVRREPFRTKPGQYLTVVLFDKTGTISAKVWDNIEEFAVMAQVGTVLKMAGDVTEYRGDLELTMQKARAATPEEYTLEDFVPASPQDVAALMTQLEVGGEKLQNVSIKALVSHILGDAGIRTALLTAPCSAHYNHAYLGGWVEHTVEMLALAEVMLALYPQANPDLVRAGVLLVNVGKAQAYTTRPFITETPANVAQGHILLGYAMVMRALLELEHNEAPTPFVPADIEPLKHILAAQSGRLEWGSPVLAHTLEAEIVHGCEYLSARANAKAHEALTK